MAIINRFDLGLVTGVDPMYLLTAQATKLLDANIERVGMQSARAPRHIGEAKMSFYQFPILDSEPQEFHVTSSSRFRSYAEFQGALCYSDGGPECKITTGEMDGADFKWNTMGVEAPVGTIVAELATLEHLVGADTTLNIHGFPSAGFIVSSTIRYRVLEESSGVIYTHTIYNNTGYSTVDWVLPSAGYKVYRELLTEYGDYSDDYVLVNDPLQTTFTDGLVDVSNNITATTKEISIPSGHRLSVLGAAAFQCTYTITVLDDKVKLFVNNLHKIEGSSWTTTPLSINLTSTDLGARGLASTFVHDDILYNMVQLGEQFCVYKLLDATVTEVFNSSAPVSTEFFKCTTVEYNSIVYFFSPSEGLVGEFDGSVFTQAEKMPKFPYAKAEDSVYSLITGTNEIYALLNERHVATIRYFTLPDFTISLTKTERVSTDIVRGLGGTSGSILYDDVEEEVVFPVHGSTVKFKPTTADLTRPTGRPVSIPKSASSELVDIEVASDVDKAFAVIDDDTLQSMSGTESNAAKSKSLLNSVLLGSASTFSSVSSRPAILGVPLEHLTNQSLSGTFVYTVAQVVEGGGAEGPIMDVSSNPVSVHKGSVIVDTSGVTHAEPLRLYRTGGYLTRFTMVEDIDLPETYYDTRADMTIALGRQGVIDYVYGPPENLSWLTEHKGMLFGAVQNTLYWCEPGNAHGWDKLNSFIIVDRDITGLASTGNGLLIFMRGRIKLLQGESRLTFSLRTVTNEKGTIDSQSIQAVKRGALFFSEDGLCFTDGSSVQELSYDILGPQRFDTISSCATNRSYYAIVKAFTTDLLRESMVILRYDFGKAPVFSCLSADDISGVGIINGQLAHSTGELLYETLSQSERTFNYKSGLITDQAPTMIKEFDRIRVVGVFRGTLYIYIDEVLVLKEELTLSSAAGVYNSHIKKEANKGKAISFEILGKGFIGSFEYSLTGRRTTK